jgi:lipopolysaccharide transport system permease protein
LHALLDPISSAEFIRRGEPVPERGTGIIALLRSIYGHWGLVRELARRDLTDLHAGQAAGVIWLVIHPVTMFLVYAFLFTVVFKVRIGNGGPSDYLIYLFSGLAPWLLTQDVLSRAPGVLLNNQTIVKKVMFPIEVLVAKTVASAVVVQTILMGAVIGYIVYKHNIFQPMYLMLPVVVVLHLILLWGLALLLSSFTPYFRDLGEVVRIFLTVNIYLIPVMYVPSMLPTGMQFALLLNPFSHLIWCYQDVLYSHALAHPHAWIVLGVMSASALLAGSYVFVRLRHHFASVI